MVVCRLLRRQHYGITMYFWNHPNKYIFVDGYQYWGMKDSEDELEIRAKGLMG